MTLHPLKDEDETIAGISALVCECGCPVFYVMENGEVECVSCSGEAKLNNYRRDLH